MKMWMVVFIFVLITLVGLKLAETQIQKQKKIETLLKVEINQLNKDFETTKKELIELQNSDQIGLNNKMTKDLSDIKKGYSEAIKTYENLIDFKGDKKQYAKLDTFFAQTLAQLADNNYSSASATLRKLVEEIKSENDKKVALVPVVKPPSGQSIKTSSGEYTVNVVSADLRTTKVIVDTASSSDCGDNCPVMALATYVARTGAYAAINGPYFCPASYPTCANKKNSFDTLMMNKNKTYFNSSNNVYSNVPAAIFSTTSRFVAHSSEWGRDTGVDSVIAGQPLLVFNGQSQFSGDGDPKKSGKGNRPFIGATDNTVYIGIVYNATVAEAATVIANMGIKNAINLDSGGSTAMWNGGRYVAGPGRELPFGIMLVKR